MHYHSAELAMLLADDLKNNFKLFVLHYQSRLYAFAFRQTGSPQDAEDITQEAFIQAYYAMVDYPPQRIKMLALQPWLYKIALNIFCKSLRRNKFQLVALNIADDGEHTLIEDDASSQPELLLEDQESLRELESLLVKLPMQYREAVNLYYFAELSYREIADLLNQPIGTVKSHLHRGIQLLRKTQNKREREWIQ